MNMGKYFLALLFQGVREYTIINPTILIPFSQGQDKKNDNFCQELTFFVRFPPKHVKHHVFIVTSGPYIENTLGRRPDWIAFYF